MTTHEMQSQALSRAQNCRGAGNMLIVFHEFQQRGIHIDDILPGENVLTFNAWKALGRCVCKGEKGVCLVSWVPCGKVDPETGKSESVRPKNAYVFHISQTKPIGDKVKPAQVPAPLADWTANLEGVAV